MHASCLLHDLADTRLALLERLQGVALAHKFFPADTHPARVPKIDLGHGVLALGILRRVDLPQDLQVVQPIHLTFFLGAVREFAFGELFFFVVCVLVFAEVGAEGAPVGDAATLT